MTDNILSAEQDNIQYPYTDQIPLALNYTQYPSVQKVSIFPSENKLPAFSWERWEDVTWKLELGGKGEESNLTAS
jgi:hypothetical protein